MWISHSYVIKFFQSHFLSFLNVPLPLVSESTCCIVTLTNILKRCFWYSTREDEKSVIQKAKQISQLFAMRNQRADNRPVTLTKAFSRCMFSAEDHMSINTDHFLNEVHKFQLDDREQSRLCFPCPQQTHRQIETLVFFTLHALVPLSKKW